MGKDGCDGSDLERTCPGLEREGGLDLEECFIDGTLVIAKKGALGWEKPSGAKVRSSWQWQRALVLLSPYPLQVLAGMKGPWQVYPEGVGRAPQTERVQGGGWG